MSNWRPSDKAHHRVGPKAEATISRMREKAEKLRKALLEAVGRLGGRVVNREAEHELAGFNAEVVRLFHEGTFMGAIPIAKSVIESSSEGTHSSRHVPNWFRYIVRSGALTVFVGTVLWFLLGCVRLAIAPVQSLGVVEISWLGCPFLAAVLYLSFPELQSRFMALVRISFYIMALLGLLAVIATLLGRPSQQVSWLLFIFASNAVLLLLMLGRRRAKARFKSTAPPNGNYAAALRLNLAGVLWVLLTTTAFLAPITIAGALMRLHLWRLFPLWGIWLIVNVDALYRSHRSSVSARIGIVMTLLFAFYGLLLVSIFNLFRYPDPVNLWLGAVLFLALLPLRFRRKPPGVRLTREAEPAIWKLIDEIARATNQRTPDHLYTIAEVNAYAGRMPGANFLILGLPLVAVLRTSELSAVIAHEFGHYRANDAAWAVQIYRCRHAIDNVIKRFRELEEMVPARCHWMMFRAGVRVASLPFRTYNMIFQRALRSVIEAQEHAADQIASDVAGPWAVRNAIRVVERASTAFDGYWQKVVLPSIKTGYRPRLSEGFVEYLRKGEELGCSRTRGIMLAVGFAALEFHPSVQSRLANLLVEPDVEIPAADSDPRAIELIRNVEEHERQILTLLSFNGLVDVLGKNVGPAV
jgi:Zn-dependent protease with chaperone function